MIKSISAIAAVAVGLAAFHAAPVRAAEAVTLIDAPKRTAPPPPAGAVFKDCPQCPEMVVVPPGGYTMGSTPETIKKYLTLSSAGDEGPQHHVDIRHAFAVSRFLITVGQFRQFVKETGHWTGNSCHVSLPEDGDFRGEGYSWDHLPWPQTDQNPVVCITYEDTCAYIGWLVNKTGKAYRLLTETEWEYMARGGTQTAYFFGDNPDDLCKYARVANLDVKALGHGPTYDRLVYANCHDGLPNVGTAPVGTYKPNNFGLYDVVGNAWTRLEDCYHGVYRDGTANYEGAPADESVWRGGNCQTHVIRGAGWKNAPTHYRSANRQGGYNVQEHPGEDPLPPGQTVLEEAHGGFNYYGDYVGMRIARGLY